MDTALSSMWLQTLVPLIATGLIAAALIILWRRTHSTWLAVALAAEVAGLAFRGVMALAYEFTREHPFFFTAWMLTSLIFAASLLGYAIEATQKPSS
jgi:hypothetical protein